MYVCSLSLLLANQSEESKITDVRDHSLHDQNRLAPSLVKSGKKRLMQLHSINPSVG